MWKQEEEEKSSMTSQGRRLNEDLLAAGLSQAYTLYIHRNEHTCMKRRPAAHSSERTADLAT